MSGWAFIRRSRPRRELRRRYQEGRLAREIAAAQETLAQELAAAQEVVANLPQALQDARRAQRRGKRPWVIAGAAVVVLAGGAAAFSIVRRSVRREPRSRRHVRRASTCNRAPERLRGA